MTLVVNESHNYIKLFVRLKFSLDIFLILLSINNAKIKLTEENRNFEI